MRTRLKVALVGACTAAVCAVVALVALAVTDGFAPRGPLPVHEDAQRGLLVDDARTLTQLETRGLSFSRIVGADGLSVIARTVESDMNELTKDAPRESPRRPFRPEWLTRGWFELVGVVNRLDRRVFDATTCGEIRLVYRLAFAGRKRPSTRLPMTVNVRLPQLKPKGASDCRDVARRWLEMRDLGGLADELGPERVQKIEVNFQSIHIPSSQEDMDDNAEYVLRAFDVVSGKLVPARLFNSPRTDLDPNQRAKLLAWVEGHVAEIDEGAAVVPDEFLATKATSVSPRGLVHIANRPFSQLLGSPRTALGHVSFAGRQRARTPELLVRRLDELTCVGCHQTRGVAGFHLLGEEREPHTSFNALAVGHSPHLGADLGWRAVDLASAAKGEPSPARPFAAYPDGGYGAECGLVPGLAEWKCNANLVCRDLHHGEWGVCSPATAAAPGEPCEDVDIQPSARANGAVVKGRKPDATCPAFDGTLTAAPFCAPNWLGFTGGMCSEICTELGEIVGGSICAPLPAAGYEAECFLSREPVEKCLVRHYASARVAKCDRGTPCRDDYGCARVPGAPPGTGACVPPYFIFQARVDGPILDR